MFNFDLKKAGIFQTVQWQRTPIFRFVKFFKKCFSALFVLSFLIFLYGFLPQNFTLELNKKMLGLSLFFGILTIICWLKECFFNWKLKKPKISIELKEVIKSPEKYNLAEFLSFEVAKTIYDSKQFVKKKKLPEINSSVLFYLLLKNNSELNFIFSRVLLSVKEIKKILELHFKISENRSNKEILYSKDFEQIIFESFKIAQKRNGQRIEIGDILIALTDYNLVFKNILINASLKKQDIENLVWWLESLKEKIGKRKRWWEYENLLKKGTLAKEWTAGFTVLLDKFSVDWSEKVTNMGFPEVVGHQKELEQVERILAGMQEDNNVLLIGQPGTGRKSVLQALATKSVLGQSLPEINYKRIKELNLPSLLAQLENKEEIEAILDQIFQEVLRAGNIILFIDELHNFVGGKEKPGTIDISGILSSYLKFPQFQVFAITDFVGLHKNIEQNPSILSLFNKVEVAEISKRETLILLEKVALGLEFKYKKFISYPVLRDIITYTDRYLPNLPFPEKALDILNETVVYVVSTKEKIVLSSHVSKIVSEKTQIPVGKIEEKEKKILLNLEELIHQRIINQDEAVNQVSASLRRARAQVTIRKGPLGCFLFLGPTGVGKTETAKALTEIYFGSETKMIRLDMSEFQTLQDIPRLIGSSQEDGLLTTQVRENPFSLILLDEIEKAHPNVLNLFLQVLDEGFLTDGLGRKIHFKDSIIIATSNAGYKIILKALKDKEKWENVKQKLLDYVFEKSIFRPEFINRFDDVVVFTPLSQSNLLDIAELMLKNLQKNLKEKDIDFIITKELKEKIAELGYNPVFGARQMRRVIQDKVENVLAKAILSNKLKRGDRVKVLPDNFELKTN